MTIDDGINYLIGKVELEKSVSGHFALEKQFLQIASWLEELKTLKQELSPQKQNNDSFLGN